MRKLVSVGFSRETGVGAASGAGLSVSFALLVLLLLPKITMITSADTLVTLLIAGLLVAPLMALITRRARRFTGQADFYTLAHGQRAPLLLFPVGWLLLGGYVAVSALLTSIIVSRIGGGLLAYADIKMDTEAVLAVVLGLTLLNEIVSSGQKWWSRSLLIWGAVVTSVGAMIWAFFALPRGLTVMPTVDVDLHDLATVSLCAVVLWGVDIALDQRETLAQAQRKTFPMLLLVAIVPMVVAGIGSMLLNESPYLIADTWLDKLTESQAIVVFASRIAAIIICWVGLSRALSRVRRLYRHMLKDGFLPEARLPAAGVNADILIVLLVVAGIAFAATHITRYDLVGGAAVSILWVVAFIVIPTLFQERKTAQKARFAAPFIAFVVLLVCAFLSVILPDLTSRWILIWVAIGAVEFALIGRKGLVRMSSADYLADSGSTDAADSKYRVLVCMSEKNPSAGLLRAAVALARNRHGEILLLRILRDDESLPAEALKKRGEAELELCRKIVAAEIPGDVRSRNLVRIASTPASGILSAATETRANVIFMGWSDTRTEEDALAESAVMDRVFASATRPVVAFKGEIRSPAGKMLVATAGGPHAPAALRLTAMIAAENDTTIDVLHVLTGDKTEAEAEEILRQTIATAEPVVPVTTRMVKAENLATTIIAEASAYDGLVLGASIDDVLKQTVPRGLPARLVRKLSIPVVVAKSAERARTVLLRRTWGFISNPLPTLSVSARAEIYSEMRRSARANVDFYALMSLAAAIAVLGLIQNSAAVIIGAMLVAPLMSPILALAQGIVQGNIRMIRRSGSSTAKGVFVAIAVATVLTLIFAAGPPSPEILARTNPSMLDLGVALASGAAAAYACSRKNLSAALPGVAIAAALVPPLCVVGYGIGVSAFDISKGAMLLFLTNLSAIVLAGAVIFLILGFRPTRAVRGVVVRRAIIYAIFATLVLAIPLGLATKQKVQKARVSDEIMSAFRREAATRFNLRSLDVTRAGDEFLVDIVVHSSEEIPDSQINDFRVIIGERVGLPVRVRASIVPAMLSEIGPGWVPPPEPEPEEGPDSDESRGILRFHWPWEDSESE